jgi:hypothetical protein
MRLTIKSIIRLHLKNTPNVSMELFIVRIENFSLKAVYYTIVVHKFNLQEKTTSTVDNDNKSV